MQEREVEGLKKRIIELEKELHQKEQILSNSPSALFTTSKDGKIVSYHGPRERLDLPLDKFINRSYFDTLPEKAAKQIQKSVEEAEQKGFSQKEYSLEVNNQIKEYIVKTRKYEEGHFVHVVNDVTETKQTLRRVERSEEKLRTITNNMADFVFTMDLDLNMTYVSPSIEKIVGEKPESYMKKSLQEKHPPEALQKLTQMYAEELKKEENPKIPKDRTKIVEVQHYNQDGGLMDVSIHLSFIRDKEGKPTGLQGITRDITEIKKAERERQKTLEELTHINQIQEKLFSVLGHDLRSPFNTILGFSEMLSQGYDHFPDDQKKRMIKNVLDSSQNAYNLLEELLDWSMASKAEERYNPEPLDMRGITSEIQKLNEININLRELNFYNGIFPDTTIEADKQMFSSIMRNLISNAIKYSEEKGSIYITAQEKDNNYQIKIEDTGRGMDTERQRKLFTTEIESEKGTRGEPGVGLGLNLVKRFTERHKGKIDVESELGEGTTIYLTLPKKQY